jgi:hypothetical protein
MDILVVLYVVTYDTIHLTYFYCENTALYSTTCAVLCTPIVPVEKVDTTPRKSYHREKNKYRRLQHRAHNEASR